jgi:putative ABC transport system substrate-binding protein
VGSKTATIPIVFVIGDDPVKVGLVASFSRPGSNITGISAVNSELSAKRVGLLHELVPNASTIAVLVNSNNANSELEITQRAALSLGLRLVQLDVSDEDSLGLAFEKLAQFGAGALAVNADPFFNTIRDQIIALAASKAIPAIYFERAFASLGGLISYGSSLPNAYRQAGTYTGRILRGEKAAELPVVQPTNFEMVLNLKTAKALGIELPPTLLARADEVIE